jgi:hypothetical protein
MVFLRVVNHKEMVVVFYTFSKDHLFGDGGCNPKKKKNLCAHVAIHI